MVGPAARRRSAPPGQNTDLRLAADKYLSGHPALDPRAVRRQRGAARGVPGHPPHRDRPDHRLARPAAADQRRPWRAVYAALGDLAATGCDVDLVTLSAQILRTAQTPRPRPRPRGPAPRGRRRDRLPARAPAQDRRRGPAPRHRRRPAPCSCAPPPRTPPRTVPELLDEAHVVLERLRHLASVLPDDAAHPAGASRLRIVHTRELDPTLQQPPAHEGPVAG